MPHSFDFEQAPGYLIRRAHQKSVAVFAQETAAYGITPVQFAILSALMAEPGEDQITLASRVAFDAATSGSVLGRLEAKGWVRRAADPQDKRRKLLWLTPEGEQLAVRMKRAAARAQSRMLEPLSAAQRQQLIKLLQRVVSTEI